MLLALCLGACGTAIAARPTTGSTTGTSTASTVPWCVTISRHAAITRVMRDTSEVSPRDAAVAKLVDGPELHTLNPGLWVSTNEFAPSSPYWAVAVTGTITPDFGRGKYSWAIFAINAHTGDVTGMSAGPEPKPPGFDALPDHTGECSATP